MANDIEQPNQAAQEIGRIIFPLNDPFNHVDLQDRTGRRWHSRFNQNSRLPVWVSPPARHKTSPAGPGSRSGGRSSRLTDDSQLTSRSWRDMEGPSFYCAYLGFTAISKPPTSMATPVRDMYYKYRKSPTTGRSASLRLTQRGVLVVLYDDGIVNSEIFFDFSAVVFVEAAKFTPVKTSSERKPKAFFLPVEQDGGSKSGPGAAVLDKHAFFVEKSLHFLVTSSHPPLVVCVVRRPQGVKALDCHIFALDTIENALHISNLIASAQTPGPGVAGGRASSNFDKTRGGGDVIRTEYGEYSVYRGPQGPNYDGGVMGHTQPRGLGSTGGGGGGASGPPGGRNGYLGGGVPGGIVLTQDNFMSDSSSDHQHHFQQSQPYPHHQQNQFGADVSPGVGYGGVGSSNGGAMLGPGAPPNSQNRNYPPDVIMHARPMSRDIGSENGFSYTPVHDRSFGSIVMGGGGSSDHGSGVRMRYEDGGGGGGGGGGNPARYSGDRLSGGQMSPRGPVDYPPGGGGKGGYVPPGGRPMFPGGHIPPNEPARPPVSPLYNSPPLSPREHESDMMRSGAGREIFSASNRESRAVEEEEVNQMIGGRPVAKVPPHFKAGIKVLPSDFRMVKLKHKPMEEKRSDSISDDSYDNNKEMVDRYREMQEVERENYPDVAASAHMRGGEKYGRDGVDNGIQDRNYIRDYRSRWSDHPSSNTREGNGLFYDDRGSEEEHASRSKNRHSTPANYSYEYQGLPGRGGEAGFKSQSAYNIGGGKGDVASVTDSTGSGQARAKDLEIANMFSNIRLDRDGGSGNHLSYGLYKGRNDLMSSSTDQHDFENGLGYLP
ncbi:hypothetical protein PoB_005407900 [Plakobranchus ocellatus]|uniref:PID domain-containing protein n=1 Tax=Plakobranchus ocellatus TaxID=259542 RepID=A0AAV4C4V0_9GAST|nr:hypothetical protein PoB_005407900 [Plakobranchus ocellatus]